MRTSTARTNEVGRWQAAKAFGAAGTPFEQEKNPLIKRETLELVRAYYKIREGRVRKRIFEMVKAMVPAAVGVAETAAAVAAKSLPAAAGR